MKVLVAIFGSPNEGAAIYNGGRSPANRQKQAFCVFDNDLGLYVWVACPYVEYSKFQQKVLEYGLNETEVQSSIDINELPGLGTLESMKEFPKEAKLVLRQAKGVRLHHSALPNFATCPWPPAIKILTLPLSTIVLDRKNRIINATVGKNGEGSVWTGRLLTEAGLQELEVVFWGPQALRQFLSNSVPYVCADARFKEGNQKDGGGKYIDSIHIGSDNPLIPAKPEKYNHLFGISAVDGVGSVKPTGLSSNTVSETKINNPTICYNFSGMRYFESSKELNVFIRGDETAIEGRLPLSMLMEINQVAPDDEADFILDCKSGLAIDEDGISGGEAVVRNGVIVYFTQSMGGKSYRAIVAGGSTSIKPDSSVPSATTGNIGKVQNDYQKELEDSDSDFNMTERDTKKQNFAPVRDCEDAAAMGEGVSNKTPDSKSGSAKRPARAKKLSESALLQMNTPLGGAGTTGKRSNVDASKTDMKKKKSTAGPKKPKVSDEIFIVEKFMKMEDGKVLVKYEGHDQPEWQPVKHMKEELKAKDFNALLRQLQGV